VLAETPRLLRISEVAVLLAALLSGAAGAQTPGTTAVPVVQLAVNVDSAKHHDASAFFQSQDPIEVTLTTNIGRIRGDKGDNPPWRQATLSYKASEGSLVTVPIKARTRGIWRLKMCDFPPLRLNFSGETSKGTIFFNLDKPKLVSYCPERGHVRAIHPPGIPAVSHLPADHAGKSQGAPDQIHLRRQRRRKGARSAIRIHHGGTEGSRGAPRGKVMEQKGAGGENLDPLQDALLVSSSISSGTRTSRSRAFTTSSSSSTRRGM